MNSISMCKSCAGQAEPLVAVKEEGNLKHEELGGAVGYSCFS